MYKSHEMSGSNVQNFRSYFRSPQSEQDQIKKHMKHKHVHGENIHGAGEKLSPAQKTKSLKLSIQGIIFWFLRMTS
jgi:hypothetical protein